MPLNATPDLSPVVTVRPGHGASGLVLVCEHASAMIPPELKALGLSDADRLSHAAWDPGAVAVAKGMAAELGGALVSSEISRLVYDCNRPPEAPDAMPAQSEVIVVPGNAALSDADRAERVRLYYEPFRAALAAEVAAHPAPVLVTIHSFTPVYYGKPRSVEIGVLHDSDARLADAMLAVAGDHTAHRTERNAPYGPEDRVTHTLREHALPGGHLNVMIEIRNDLIATEAQQNTMAAMMSAWLAAALAQIGRGQDA
ncbi:N-formylglutamate amidohydrolase [Puniceibacterium sediminis]|uniref:Predicted N-formylglutamate amidohydrolase n=1 Tax=Puniceibacterium sediminis TaxID=1608407 RepID=A0A238YXC1_9RHOB|nr:N-formylglutamate amidohydrolase [Puniceibacterium sediminis]SNR75730.1 Predicted N-formylglutamate amidohydrolase [Puniceibacterium sediminis]